MAYQVDLTFPDSTYSSATKPSTAVMSADLLLLQNGHNSLDDAALYIDGTKAMAGDLDMDGNKITNLAAPTDDDDVARKRDANPVGAVIEFAGATASSGYLMCNGSAVSRTTYADLFAVISTTFGEGDGSTTFNVPDKRDRVGVGAGSTYTLGQEFGASTINVAHTHAGPSHTHTGPSHLHTLGNHQHGIPPHWHYLGIGWDNNKIYTRGDTPLYGSTTGTGNTGTTNVDTYTSTTYREARSETVSSVVTDQITGNTGTGGTGNTGSGGTGSTGSAGSAVQSVVQLSVGMNFIIKY